MHNTFEYSILQYKHSQLLNEAVNVGIAFYFPQLNHFFFAAGDPQRVKALYPEFDSSLFSKLIRGIEGKAGEIKFEKSLFSAPINFKFERYLHEYILKEDATVLEFSKPIIGLLNFSDVEKTVRDFSNLYLPSLHTKHDFEERKNEQYLFKRVKDSLFRGEESIKRKISTNKVIDHKGLQFKFDFSWQNGSFNLIKTISFDLLDEGNIQNKAATHFGNFTLLREKALKENYRFDIVVSKPQVKELHDAFDKALGILDQIEAPKKIILENEINQYSSEAIDYLESH